MDLVKSLYLSHLKTQKDEIQNLTVIICAMFDSKFGHITKCLLVLFCMLVCVCVYVQRYFLPNNIFNIGRNLDFKMSREDYPGAQRFRGILIEVEEFEVTN